MRGEGLQPLSHPNNPPTSVLSAAEVQGPQVDAVACDEASLLVHRQPVPLDQDPPGFLPQHCQTRTRRRL